MSFHYNENGSSKTLVIKEAISTNDINEIKRGNYSKLWLRLVKIEPLADLMEASVNITELKIESTKVQNIDWINKCVSLTSLELQGKYNGVIDLSNLPNLGYLHSYFNVIKESITAEKNKLETLSLVGFRGSLNSFSDRAANNIKLLGLTGGDINNLNGIHRFKKLESVVLDRTHSLEEIDQLVKLKKLKRLSIYSCNNITSYEVLKNLTSLRSITFENKSIPSLNLLPKKLEKLFLGSGTLILDNNVEILLDYPNLERAVFRKKKGYKYSALQLKEILDSR